MVTVMLYCMRDMNLNHLMIFIATFMIYASLISGAAVFLIKKMQCGSNIISKILNVA